MSTRKKSNNFVQRLLKQTWRFFDVAMKAVVNRLLRSLFLSKRQSRLSRAGFVLPTVVMMVLVVTLLTTAIMIRSFDRSKNASNVRVDQAVINAATPALDRARAKIDRLFSVDETELQGNTPPEANIASILEQKRYALGDETQIQLTGDFTPADPSAKTLKSAWKFPVDTDNNGKFDTYTLYGIYFRNPQQKETRPRGTTEARALPQNDGQGERCSNGSAGGVEGWEVVGGQLKKAFFTYVANVPITDTTGLGANYEPYKGNKGFSALEMQLDQARVSLDNNAIWYNDDLAITLIPSLRLNGRVHTNSNLLVENADENPIIFRQVSSPESCFYNPANAKIIVGGNVAAGGIGRNNSGSNAVKVDLYKGKNTAPDQTPVINASNTTTTNTPSEVAANSDAFTQRLDVLVQGAINLLAGQDATDTTVSAMAGRYPQDVIDAFNKKYDPSNPGGGLNALTQTLQTYFGNRIRRVSFAEVPINPPTPDAAITVGGAKLSPVVAPTDGGTFVFSGGGEIKPPMEWMTIDPNNTKLTLNINGSTMQMPATKPATGATALTQREDRIGDRVQVGNNLPNRWVKQPDGTFAKAGDPQPIDGVNWNDGGQRERTGLAEQLDDLGDTSRNGYWETAAAKLPPLDQEDLAGGLRVVTGAGIYVDGFRAGAGGTGKRMSGATPVAGDRSFLPEPTLASDVETTTLPPNYTVVWPDSMPMYQWLNRATPNIRKPIGAAGAPEQLKGDLQMRATVVYHYKNGNPDEPLACISSYYDPTDSYTADIANKVSDNGVSYAPPATSRAASPRLRRQSRMVFPDGRWANKPLYDAFFNLDRGRALSLADKAAFDAANCALAILDGSATPGGVVPDNAIKERAFLDARQVKALHKVGTELLDPSNPKAPVAAETKLLDLNNPDHLKMASREALVDDQKMPDYTLPLEQRQPLEVRVTEIDLEALKGAKTDSGENLFPNSGIIYATRDDALPDLSATQQPANARPNEIRNKKNTPSEAAATDFKLDPTRRPNGIRLVKGSNLARSTTYEAAEKGLILASDLPVYVKGDFNLHQASGGGDTLEEFTEKVKDTPFYDRKTPDLNFACRKGSPTSCGSSGDQWRAARILSDAITLLSNEFRDGYRTEGDYDLRNNAGNLAVESYLDNGFWMNSFATTANWYDPGTGLPKPEFEVQDDQKVGSSYVMNAVTPIQRRVNFPAYKMEICNKLPASECSPQDWVGGSLVDSVPAKAAQQRTRAGTTAPSTNTPGTEAARYEVEHYPRRVAFERGAFGQLTLEPNADVPDQNGVVPNPNGVSAKPLTPAGAISYVSPPTNLLPRPDNTLWFATASTSNNPSAPPDYNNTSNLLYYAPDEPEKSDDVFVHERQLLLPGTPAFPDEFRAAGYDPAFTGTLYQTVLNGNSAQDPSDYALCTNKDNSQSLTPTVGGGACPALAQSRQMLTALFLLPAPAAGTPLEKVLYFNTPADLTQPLTATKKVNVFNLNLPPSGVITGPITLDAGGQSDPIFIIRRSPGGVPLWTFNEVPLTLKGVDPNNIFWITRTGVRISGSTTQLAGNFMGLGRLIINEGVQINGGRFLGFANAKINGTPTITALTTTAQPLVVPVVQLYSPTGTPGTQNSKTLNESWLQTATETTFNAVFVMGDSPPRPLPSIGPTAAESNGGLGNFPRFLEAWGVTTTTGLKSANISGGLIQLKRSGVASAPFQTITDPLMDTSLFLDTPPKPTLSTQGGNDPQTGDSDYLYRGGASGFKAPYYMPPDRQWGYDVGLLSQTPDLFSRRFVAPQAGTPNEFFREVARDDKWVNTLLCGKTVDDKGIPVGDALPAAQRPTNCQ